MSVESSLKLLVSYMVKIKELLDQGYASSESTLEKEKANTTLLINQLLRMITKDNQRKWLADAYDAIRNNNKGKLESLIEAFESTFRT